MTVSATVLALLFPNFSGSAGLFRQILLLREIQGLSYEEIAQVLELETGTVKSRIFRARKRLSVFLLRDGNIPGFVSSSNTGGGDEP